jgi:hypothetical protein
MKKILVSLLVLGVLFAAAPALAANAGQFTEVQGRVSVRRANGPAVYAAIKTQVNQGDVITTEKASKATVLFKDGSVIRMGPSTKLTVNKLVYEEDRGVVKAAYEVASGTIMSVVGSLFGNNESEYKVKTPTSVSGVRGTMFIVHVETNEATGKTTTSLVSIEGTVNFSGSGGNYDVNGGMFSQIGPDGNPTTPAPVDDAYMQALLESVTLGTRSVDERAGGLRDGALGDDLLPPSELPSLYDLITDPNAVNSTDNPADLFYQEPPQATELIIILNFPGGGG